MKNKKEPRSILITDIDDKLEIFRSRIPSLFVGAKSKELRKLLCGMLFIYYIFILYDLQN